MNKVYITCNSKQEIQQAYKFMLSKDYSYNSFIENTRNFDGREFPIYIVGGTFGGKSLGYNISTWTERKDEYTEIFVPKEQNTMEKLAIRIHTTAEAKEAVKYFESLGYKSRLISSILLVLVILNIL